MANFPDIREIGGRHLDVYEAYYRGLDPKNTNQIGAIDAAKFLKKSGLSDVVLSRVWDLSDPLARGFLDKTGLFVALKLISLAQAGEKIDVKNLRMETNAPRCGDVPKMKPPPVPKMTHPGVPPHPSVAAASANADWTMKPEEKTKYQALFTQLQPENGVLPGNKVKGVLMNSKLPLDTLSAIWELADQDKDGSLDEHEFLVAMHLVYKALENRAIPSALPKELQKQALQAPPADDFGGGFVANFPTDIVPVAPSIPPPARPPIPAASIPSIPAPTSYGPNDWVLTTIEKLKYQEVFEKSDLDKDGLVSGLEIKDIFLKSGLPQNMLAHIWALCDTNQTGKLNNEQFALAMWLIDRKKKGIDPPQALAPEMIPPSMRPNAAPPQPPKPIYTNPELEMISKEIEELTKERHAIEAEVAQKEADIRIKNGEMRSLQSELDTLTATLKQLENQKEAAQKRLDDLKAQVDKLKEQCQKQEDTIKEQETELDSRKEELQKLKDEEKALEQEYDSNLKEKDKISVQLQDTQLQISQVRAMFTQLEEIQRQMKDALELCKVAIEENNAAIVSDYSLNIEPEFRDFKKALTTPEEKPKDAFNDNSFNDAFKPATSGFDDSFDNKASGFGDDDKWGNDDKWNDPFGATAAANDPFAGSNNDTSTKDNTKDAFESDPFAALHAPPKGSTVSPIHAPESPSPALPPKQAKKPPPRPAPPKPKAPEAFASSGFANFDDFDLKASTTSLHTVESVKTVIEVKASSKSTQELSTDFQEDPFKNYRYEDPFMIEDPFKDENGNKKAEKEKFDDFFEKDTFGQESFNQGTASAFEPFGKPETKSSSPFGKPKPKAAPFDAFNNSEAKSSPFEAFGKPESKNSAFEAFGKPESKSSPFEAFNKSESKSSAFEAFGSSESKSSPAFEAFGKQESKSSPFEAFGKTESKSSAFEAFGKSDFSNNNTESAFEPFGTNDFSNNKNNNGNGDAFDPFGLAVNDLKKKTSTSAAGFGFEGDFANFDAFNNNSTVDAFNVSSNGNDAWGSSSTMTKVKKDDGFASWGKKENTMPVTSKSKKHKEPEGKTTKIDKFSADYSDNYEHDLNEILKRSMVDQ